MKSNKLWRHILVSLIAAGPVGGFIFGLLHPGDPDPNPVGRVVYAGMMAVLTPLHGGFPPHHEAGAVQTFNAWPHMIISGLLIFGWFAYRERRMEKKLNG